VTNEESRELKIERVDESNFDTFLHLIFFHTDSSFHAKPTLFLEDIFVLEEYRRAGIGQEMFEFCIRKAAESGCGRMEGCVLDWNLPAIDPGVVWSALVLGGMVLGVAACGTADPAFTRTRRDHPSEFASNHDPAGCPAELPADPRESRTPITRRGRSWKQDPTRCRT